MRSPERIDALLDQLGKVWKQHPDWRFGQLMANFFGWYGADVFGTEDDEWMRALQDFSEFLEKRI